MSEGATVAHGSIAIVVVPFDGQPALSIVTFSVTAPLAPAVNTIEGVTWPDVIVPLKIDHE